MKTSPSKIVRKSLPASIVYVDDELVLNEEVKETRKNGIIISKSIETVSLEANTDKSAIIVLGKQNDVTKGIKKELTDDPMRLHGKPVKCKESEPY